MHNEKYKPTDRFEELIDIDLDEVLALLEIIQDNQLLDFEICSIFLARILQDPTRDNTERTLSAIGMLVRKAASLAPLNPPTLDLAGRMSNNTELLKLSEKLSQFPDLQEITDMRRVLSSPIIHRRKRDFLENTLAKTPGHIIAASQRLLFDLYEGKPPGKWLDSITIPKFAKPAWRTRIFQHYASLKLWDQARPLWEQIITDEQPAEPLLNLAAEMYVALGNTELAIELYKKSLSIDKNQGPIHYRLAELQSPFRPNNSLVSQKDVIICLYSWNKASYLKKTLQSLSQTRIGHARIKVLLNGCSDESLREVEEARKLFPHNDLEIIELLVNVGAPAARNWLAALPDVRSCDFVAYIDDDVDLPAEWLDYYLTVMEQYPQTTVVGCKVVFGDNPGLIQYLYRAFSIAKQGMIKLTDQNLIAQYDYNQYNFIRPTDTVMGCCHLLRMSHFPDGPQFDLRYSPSQVDDIAHDLMVRINGGEVRYCGLVTCVHHQNTGGSFMRQLSSAQLGQVLGNDTKYYYFFKEHMKRINAIIENALINRFRIM